MKLIIKIVTPIMAIIAAFFTGKMLQNTPFDEKTNNLSSMDFIGIKKEVFLENKNFIRIFNFKNHKSFCINPENTSLSYSSNFAPMKAYFHSNKGGSLIPIKLSKNIFEFFKVKIPEKFKNENDFSIVLYYNGNNKIDDKMSLTIEQQDNSFIDYSENIYDLNDYLQNSWSFYRISKTIILVLSIIVISLIYLGIIIGIKYAYDCLIKRLEKKFRPGQSNNNDLIPR